MKEEQIKAIRSIIRSWADFKLGIISPQEAREMIQTAWPEMNEEMVRDLAHRYFGMDDDYDE
jgi:hypothetical protein